MKTTRPFARNALSLALFEPDIPQNFGAALRLAACLGPSLHVIEPAGFPLDDRRVRLAALDYGAAADLEIHASFERFDAARRSAGRRLVVASVRGAVHHHRARYDAADVLMVGRESGGVSDAALAAADLVVRVPMRAGARSMNVATALTALACEALRQTDQFPEEEFETP